MGRKPKRPRPFGVGSEVRVRAIRGPDDHGAWYWRAERHTTRVTVWTGWGTAAEATQAVIDRLASEDVPAPGNDAVTDIETLGDLLRCWTADVRASDRAPETYRQAVQGAKRIDAYGRRVALSRVTTQWAEGFRRHLLQRYAPSTTRLTLVLLGQAWRWGVSVGACPARPLTLPRQAVPKKPKRVPTATEVEAVLAWFEGSPDAPGGPWVVLLLHLLWGTGARIGEITHLRRSDVEPGWITVAGKTGPRRVRILGELEQRVTDHLATHERERVLGVTPRSSAGQIHSYLKVATEAVGVEYFGPHAMRRAAVDRMYRAGIDVGTAAAMLGHSPEVAMAHYRQASLQDLDRAAAVLQGGEQGKVVPFRKRGE